MSWFQSKKDDAGAQNFWPATAYHAGLGQLTEKDTEWACNTSKFSTETQVWYSVLADGSLLMTQVIWSCIGIMFIPATAQMTFKLYNPKTKESTWRSINASGFKTEGRGCRSDQFEITHSGTPLGEESYAITATLDKGVQVAVTYTRPAAAPGFKLGSGLAGGVSTFGMQTADDKRDGFVVHRFHPLLKSSGSVVIDGKAIDVAGDATFVHAIQGMRPNLVASRWNFCFFTSGGGNAESNLGSVRAVQMEFETTDDYGPAGKNSGRTKVNLGAIYTTADPSSAPLVVVGETHVPAGTKVPWAAEKAAGGVSATKSSATHIGAALDKDTGYAVPSRIEYAWEGPKLSGTMADASGATVLARVAVDASATVGTAGLIEKVDVLAEIPYVIRKGIAAVTGTKPYIYQYHNPATLEIVIGDDKIAVEGWVFNEASFISE
ncbi:putative cell survival pathways protein [Cryptotrichosporon argae]